jgi:glycosyltransferase involved in cell wall biosynthesis
MKILLLTKYSRIGASSRLRALQYLPNLKDAGFEITVKNLLDDEYIARLYKGEKRNLVATAILYLGRLLTLFSVFKYDLIWVEKEIFPYFPAFAERILYVFRRKYIVDYDDAIFHNYNLSKSFFIRKVFGRKIDAVMRYSSCVIAGNEYLASYAKAAGARKIVVMPTVVDYQRYSIKTTVNVESPIVGWMGSPSTQKYVVDIGAALAKCCQKYNARVILIGATSQVITLLPGVNVEIIPWSEDNETELIRQMDIGIMPLADGPWEAGKCGYKLIQYMACAVPVIASPVGVNREIVTVNRCGLLAANFAEWESTLFMLLESQKKRIQFGAAGRKAVESTYSLQVQAPILIEIFKNIIIQNKAS